MSKRLHICYAVFVTICTCFYLYVLLYMRFANYLFSKYYICTISCLVAAPAPNMQIKSYTIFPQIVFLSTILNDYDFILENKIMTEGLKNGCLKDCMVIIMKKSHTILFDWKKKKNLKELRKLMP